MFYTWHKTKVLKTFTRVLTIALTVISISAVAQRQFIFGIGSGYALPIAGQHYYLDLGLNNNTPQSGGSDKPHVKSSYGKGAVINFNLGFLFEKHWGIVLRNQYLFGGNIRNFVGLYYNGSQYEFDVKRHMRSYQFNPCLVFHFETKKKVTFHSDLGPMICTSTVYYQTVQNRNPYSPNLTPETYSFNQQDYGGIGFGIAGAMGVSVKLVKVLRFYLDVTFVAGSYSPKKGKVTSYAEGGKDQMSTLTVKEKETEYITDPTTVNSYYSNSQPAKELKRSVPISSIGLVAGLQISVPVKKKDKWKTDAVN